MFNYNNILKKEKNFSDLQFKEIYPVMKLILRGKKRNFLSAFGKSLNLLLPTVANTSTANEKLTAIWLSPDEWMIFSNETNKSDGENNKIEKLLFNNISNKNLGAVVNVTDHFVLIRLSGNKIFELFETGSPFNFNNFKSKNGSTTQTIMAKCDVIIHNIDKNNVNLFVRRSFSEYLISWIEDSASRL